MTANAATITHANLHEALLAVQAETPTLPKNATNPHFKSKFTPLDTVVEVMGPILGKHGLTWVTKPSVGEFGPSLEYKLTHAASGDCEEGEMPLLLSKNDPQGQGAAITYARRYAITAVLNLVADEDVDGNNIAASESAPKAGKLTKAQLTKIQARLKGVTLEELVLQLGAHGLDDISAATPAQAKTVLEALGV